MTGLLRSGVDKELNIQGKERGCQKQPLFSCPQDTPRLKFKFHLPDALAVCSRQDTPGRGTEFSTFLRKNSKIRGFRGIGARHFCTGAESRFRGCFPPRFGIVEKTVEKLFKGGYDFIEQSLNFTVVFDHPFNFDEQMIFSEPIWNGDLFCLREKKTNLINSFTKT
jgi:hypothetical protein